MTRVDSRCRTSSVRSLESKYGRELFLTSLTGEYVRIYPMPVWLDIEEKLGQMPSTHPVAAALSRSRQLLRPGRRARHAGPRAHPRPPARRRDDDRRRRRARPIQLPRRLEPRSLPRRSCSATRTPTTTRARCRSSASDDARPGHDRRGPAASAPRAGRPVRRLHGRARRPRARCSKPARRASSASIATSTRWRARARRWRPGATASSWCTPTIARSTRCSTAARSRTSTARSPTSASRRCSSTRRAAASASSATSRSTCAWIAAAATRPPIWSRARASASSPTRSSSTAKSASRAASRARWSSARREAPVDTTGRLAAIVRRAIPRRGYMRIDPATRTFQALRIWVNRELDGLDRFRRVGGAPAARGGARLVVIAFHSLEDRIVKHTLRALAAARRARAGADEEAARAGRRGSGPQPARTQREASRR